MSEKEARLPPIVRDYINTLSNTKNPMHVRENARLMLENMVAVCSKVLQEHKVFYSRKG